MADPSPPAAPDSDSLVSKETFDDTKKLAEERGTRLASAEARLAAYETREREQLKSFMPAMEGMLKELHDDAAPDTRAHFNSMLDWTRNCHERPNLDSQMQLGTVIHACASKLKRVREDASVQSATADQLAQAMKENEELKATDAHKTKRIDELNSSLKEITTNSEKLQQQLQAAGALQEKFDFSKAASREADAPAEVATGEGLVAKTENASKLPAIPAFSPSDALSAFVGNYGGNANTRFQPSLSNHSLLGSTGGEVFTANIRPM
jgi:hypothetical protein